MILARFRKLGFDHALVSSLEISFAETNSFVSLSFLSSLCFSLIVRIGRRSRFLPPSCLSPCSRVSFADRGLSVVQSTSEVRVTLLRSAISLFAIAREPRSLLGILLSVSPPPLSHRVSPSSSREVLQGFTSRGTQKP